MPPKPSKVDIAESIADLMNGIAGWILIVFGIAASLSGVGGALQQANTAEMVAPLVVLGFGLLLTVAGIFVNPRFRRRIDRRHRLSRFGQVETVENATVSETEYGDALCVSCGSGQNDGLVRRYRQEYVVAGVPLWTVSENYNFYCPSCGLDEFPSLSTTNGVTNDTQEQAIAETE